jgi:hypothetical protein
VSYNGWKNYETWNVALWINNDEGLYDLAETVAGMEGDYNTFAQLMVNEFESNSTPDGVSWEDSSLDYEALTEVLYETLEYFD